MSITVTVDLGNGVEVHFWPDGSCRVILDAMRIARHDLLGHVDFRGDGTTGSVRVEDAYVYTPLKPHVVTATIRAAQRQARFARRAARQIIRATEPAQRHEPGTLEHLVLLSEGKIREDGWPKGHMELQKGTR